MPLLRPGTQARHSAHSGPALRSGTVDLALAGEDLVDAANGLDLPVAPEWLLSGP